MFNVECVVKPSILNVILLVDAMRRILVLIKFEYMYLLYSHNNP
jgi:hypothetical protein